MKQLCAPLFLALCILQTLLATPVQAEFATFSASNLPLAPIQLAQEAIDFIVIRTRSEHSTSKSSSASIGVSYGTSGFNVSASASKSKGQGDGADLVHTHTTVSAGQARPVWRCNRSDFHLCNKVMSRRQIFTLRNLFFRTWVACIPVASPSKSLSRWIYKEGRTTPPIYREQTSVPADTHNNLS